MKFSGPNRENGRGDVLWNVPTTRAKEVSKKIVQMIADEPVFNIQS